MGRLFDVRPPVTAHDGAISSGIDDSPVGESLAWIPKMA